MGTNSPSGSVKLIPNSTHCGEFTFEVDKFGYKAIVIIGPISNSRTMAFGRVVQVRKQSGMFGTDTVLVREADGVLRSYQNMTFFAPKEEYLPMYEEAMKEVDEKNIDKEGDTYTIMENNPAVGFIVNGLDDVNGETFISTMLIKTV